LKKRNHFVNQVYFVFVIFGFITTILLPQGIAQQNLPSTQIISTLPSNQIKNVQDDNYSFFSFAIIWGEFKILNYKHPLRGLEAYNPYPYNKTMHVIGYVGYDGVGFIYKNASNVGCPWWLGFVSQHRLFVIGWGNSVQAY
jgi:hypothetical protein